MWPAVQFTLAIILYMCVCIYLIKEACAQGEEGFGIGGKDASSTQRPVCRVAMVLELIVMNGI